jgi:adenylate kinase family enzyme
VWQATVAAAVAARLGYRHVELDSIHHQPDWEPIETEVFRQIVSEIVASDGWVIDGNYGSLVQYLVFDRADTIVWLDLPRRVVMPAVTRRTLTRMALRRELWNGNRERFRSLFDRRPEENILLWSWTNHGPVTERYTSQIADPRYAAIDWVRLRSRREVARWLDSLPKVGSRDGEQPEDVL